jgi:hypothetical protein
MGNYKQKLAKRRFFCTFLHIANKKSQGKRRFWQLTQKKLDEARLVVQNTQRYEDL